MSNLEDIIKRSSFDYKEFIHDINLLKINSAWNKPMISDRGGITYANIFRQFFEHIKGSFKKIDHTDPKWLKLRLITLLTSAKNQNWIKDQHLLDNIKLAAKNICSIKSQDISASSEKHLSDLIASIQMIVNNHLSKQTTTPKFESLQLLNRSTEVFEENISSDYSINSQLVETPSSQKELEPSTTSFSFWKTAFALTLLIPIYKFWPQNTTSSPQALLPFHSQHRIEVLQPPILLPKAKKLKNENDPKYTLSTKIQTPSPKEATHPYSKIKETTEVASFNPNFISSTMGTISLVFFTIMSFVYYYKKNTEDLTATGNIPATTSLDPYPERSTLLEGNLSTRVKKEKEPFAKGCFGKVYRVVDKPLVIKKSTDRSLINEFQLSIQHECIVKITNLYIKTTSNQYYLEMEFIKGKTLENLACENQALSNELIKELLEKAKNSCAYLFEEEIAWFDLNPGNIFITDGESLKICDLGLWSKEKKNLDRAKKLLAGGICLCRNLIYQSEFIFPKLQPIKEKYKILDTVDFESETFKNYPHENQDFLVNQRNNRDQELSEIRAHAVPVFFPESMFPNRTSKLTNGKALLSFVEDATQNEYQEIISHIEKTFKNSSPEQMLQILNNYFDQVIQKIDELKRVNEQQKLEPQLLVKGLEEEKKLSIQNSCKKNSWEQNLMQLVG